MKNFNWDEFKTGNIVVHCDTEKKANDFLKQALKHNLMWLGKNYLTDSLYEQKNSDTCYRANENHSICYDSLQYYYTEDYKIIEWKVNSTKEFVKEDLKVGMLVKTTFFNAAGYGIIMPCECEDNVIAYKDEKWDYVDPKNITEVWGLCKYANGSLRFNTENRELLYERKETKKMTVKEICKELGYDVEIVKE